MVYDLPEIDEKVSLFHHVNDVIWLIQQNVRTFTWLWSDYFIYSKKSVWQGFSNDLFSFKFFQVIHKS